MMLNYYIIKVTLLLRLLEMVAFFKQIFKIITWDRNIRRRYYFCWGTTMTKLITINTKHLFYTNENFLSHFPSKMILLNILQFIYLNHLFCTLE